MALTRKGIIAVAVVGLGVAYVGGRMLLSTGILGSPTTVKSAIPVTTSIQHFTVSETAASYALKAPASNASPMAQCPVIEEIAWNGLGSLNLANGGASTAKGSMVDKYTGGQCLTIVRQDDYPQQEANLAKFVNSNGANGDAFIAIMGDAYPYVAAALQKLIPNGYEAIGVVGFSDGEDKCMLPADAGKDPQKARGDLVAAVPRDGDWNICVKWASDNGIPINVDQKTYDPAALNFIDVDDFTKADEKLIAKACEDRTVIQNGLAHGTKKVCTNGVATWTPGDVDVAAKYQGSIVGVASTHDYAGQMPALIIGAKAWMMTHHDYVVGLLKAADRGAMAIRSGQDGLLAMGQVQAQVFKEQDATYWAKYFKGVVGQDHEGNSVNLGGSKAVTLQDARDYFGLRPGTADIFASVYRVFKSYDETFYPDLYPKNGSNAIPAYEDVVDLSYVKDALADVPASSGAVVISQALPQAITQKVSTTVKHIEFDTNAATIRPESKAMLQQIEDSANVAQGLRIQINGYTDNTGSTAINTPLSEARATAVADWLHATAPANFPMARMEVHGFGPANPVCSDNTAECRAQNRRVEIVMGQ